MPDKWDQYVAVPGTDKWEQYVEPSTKKMPAENPITAPLSKATGIGPRPWDIPALQRFEQGYRSAGGPKRELGEQGNFAGNLGQFAGVLTKGPAALATFGAVAPETLGPERNITKEWQAINEAIGATKKSIRIPKSAESIEGAVTMPARGLAKEGLDAKTLSKMNPFEQQAVIKPKWDAAGQAIDRAAIDATSKNVTLNPSKSALQVTASIQNPGLREKAVRQLSDLMQEIGIRDASRATPLETLQLRRALKAGARFGPNGDLNSLGAIRAQLYSAVSGDLKGSMPGFADLDQHFSDLDSAIKAVNSSATSFSRGRPPSFIEKYGPLLRRAGATAGVGGGLLTLYDIYKHLKP